MSERENEYEIIKTNAIKAYTGFIQTIEASAYLDVTGFNNQMELMQNFSNVVEAQTSLLAFIIKH